MIFKQPAHAACVFVFDIDGNVLTVTRRNTDILSLPGGKVDTNETALSAAIRECGEETGVGLKPHLMLPIYSQIVLGDVDYYTTAFVYLATCPNNKPRWVMEPGIYAKFSTVPELLLGAFAGFNRRALESITSLR